jgi:hypothetical protein
VAEQVTHASRMSDRGDGTFGKQKTFGDEFDFHSAPLMLPPLRRHRKGNFRHLPYGGNLERAAEGTLMERAIRLIFYATAVFMRGRWAQKSYHKKHGGAWRIWLSGASGRLTGPNRSPQSSPSMGRRNRWTYSADSFPPYPTMDFVSRYSLKL